MYNKITIDNEEFELIPVKKKPRYNVLSITKKVVFIIEDELGVTRTYKREQHDGGTVDWKWYDEDNLTSDQRSRYLDAVYDLHIKPAVQRDEEMHSNGDINEIIDKLDQYARKRINGGYGLPNGDIHHHNEMVDIVKGILNKK